ncbi:hypothetical protein [Sulfolobus acidocaldarius]|uniref:Conserved protein n=5 Tax=Sulfolobus acidocaldarius TaxID=2285 RepID=Q4JC42_SULAC|nr:hypothetical protein [Sulfolobus acidocaldarius]AAY79637.1 conserved protein [Sulfolobus acidocaldarius DSM 639]AGE70191.1 hypothetical protein SacN8_01050 [Sulfolobus acidocaldarius N8]AGE72466.1 hypothetical protein SacRon12I_01050 [Sulfolobus acidocaldarius Ron12/I]ALU29399.1 hypothetical protein ATY89_05195 [Sulfolobus acidocaldarius]ALU32127.1 hypothetical protein ATZ20_08215 [Sulfolobus acidocaldarius]
MLSWIIGSPAPPWHYLRDMFEDYNNVGVYVDSKGNIQLIKVSEFDEFHITTSVLISGYHLLTLKPYYIKLRKYVAFTTTRLNVVKELIKNRNWRSMEYYYGDEFVYAWVIYSCEMCEEKQRLHLEVNEEKLNDDELLSKHLEIYNS